MYEESLISAKQFFQIKSHYFVLDTTQHTFCVKKCCQILSLNLKKFSLSLAYKLLHSKRILHSLAKLTYSNKAEQILFSLVLQVNTARMNVAYDAIRNI